MDYNAGLGVSKLINVLLSNNYVWGASETATSSVALLDELDGI